MIKRLLALLSIAVIVSITAIGSFAMPNTIPRYVDLYEDDLYIHGGQGQETWVSSRNIWTSYTCPSCGQTTSRFLLLKNTSDNKYHIFTTAYYTAYWQEYGEDTCYIGIINNTASGCVVTRGKSASMNCDYVNIGGYYYYYVHAAMDTSPREYPVYYSVIDLTSTIGERLSASLIDNWANCSMTALSLNLTSPIYDLLEVGQSGENYMNGYESGFYQGKIQGQEDAEILNDWDGFFSAFFSGVGRFFDPILNIGIGQFTVYNCIQTILVCYLALALIKIIRGA